MNKNHSTSRSETNTEISTRKKFLAIILVLILIIIFLLIKINLQCSCQSLPNPFSALKASNSDKTELNISSSSDRDTTRNTKTDLNKNSIFHGKMKFSSEIGDDKMIEFWFDGPKYRLTWSEIDEDPYLHMISADGRTLYHHSTEDDTVQISYISPKMHQWLFHEPDEYSSFEEWTEGEYDLKKYIIQKFWTIEEATQDFYLEDIVKYYQDGRLHQAVLRTSSSQPANDLVKSTYTIHELDYLEEFDEDLFSLPNN